ncbi:MAG TPA: GNAT family N-acetyltransferase [Actinospica sp.]|nr:GNAT family N-acetyltransferase [Actinospica sp.]
MATKVTLARLRAGHEAALLVFEEENRAYFARSITDRGDAYFAEFGARLRALLAEQDSGACHFHLIFDEEGALVGRINLVHAVGGVAELGYRIGERAAGRGVATAAVGALCPLAATAYGLTALVADTAVENRASRTVLERNGFAVIGETSVGAGRPAVRYRRSLVAADQDSPTG